MKGLLKLVIVVVIAIVVWKKGIPWAKEQFAGSGRTDTPQVSDTGCVVAAEAANESWSGVTRFGNPPYDLAAWGSFRSGVDDKIGQADARCSCSLDSCLKARQALTDIRSALNETDSMIRGNSEPPAGLVQRQETIDGALNQARDLMREGK